MFENIYLVWSLSMIIEWYIYLNMFIINFDCIQVNIYIRQ